MTTQEIEGLNRDRIEKLMVEILLPIRSNYKNGPISRDRCFEALNALAGAAALVITGCDGQNGEALDFFEKALKQNLSQ